MRNKKYIFAAAFLLAVAPQISNAQNSPQPAPTPKVAVAVTDNLQIPDKNSIPRERREQAYVKLLEGQRHILSMRSQRSQAAVMNSAQMAKQALQKAVELNPALAEGYTTLAEITLSTPPYNLEDALLLANLAVKIEPQNFGGHRILARLYTIKSRLNNGILDADFTQKAIAEWKEIARLDGRNAEAFAFLSEFYARTNKPAERVDALNQWIAAAPSLDPRFYSRVMGGQANLSPENAAVKLGDALLENGQTREAVEILSRAVADNPENEEAVASLQKAVESADAASSANAIQALQQAAYANPENPILVTILAQIQVRVGKIDDAAKSLRDSSAKLAEKDKISAAILQVALGDIYAGANRFDEAVAVYNNTLTVRGIGGDDLAKDEERDFAIRVFDKMIETYKKANRPNDAKAVIERARAILGKTDLFADKRLISFYRETGKKPEALAALRSLRVRNTDDVSLLRLEASLLTEDGKVDEAVELIKSSMKKKSPSSGQGIGDGGSALTTTSMMYDDFSNWLFISSLYTQAKRGREAVEAANSAALLTENTEKKQIARLTVATAQQVSGDFQGAEKTLREILKQSPRNPIALNNLGYFLTERNEKLNEALDLIKQAVEIDPTNSSFLDSLGWAHFRLGNLKDAEKYLKEAAQIDDASSTIQEHLGDVYQKQGKQELAKSAWQKALEITSDSEDAVRLKSKLNTKK